MRRAICLSFVAAAVVVSTASGQRRDLAVFDSGEIALTFDRAHFEKVEVHILPKAPGSASPFAAAGPKRHVVALHHPPRSAFRGEGRYYYPSSSAIYVTPLSDPSVKDFTAAYPSLQKNAMALRSLLLLTPREFYRRLEPSADPEPLQLPDEPFSNSGAALLAHYKRLRQPRANGYRVLTYYRQGTAGYGATNTELTYQYQGLTADERFFLTARLAVRHDRLPDSIDDPRAESDETEAEERAERKKINGWKEATFFPPLPALDEMIGSILIKP